MMDLMRKYKRATIHKMIIMLVIIHLLMKFIVTTRNSKKWLIRTLMRLCSIMSTRIRTTKTITRKFQSKVMRWRLLLRQSKRIFKVDTPRKLYKCRKLNHQEKNFKFRGIYKRRNSIKRFLPLIHKELL